MRLEEVKPFSVLRPIWMSTACYLLPISIQCSMLNRCMNIELIPASHILILKKNEVLAQHLDHITFSTYMNRIYLHLIYLAIAVMCIGCSTNEVIRKSSTRKSATQAAQGSDIREEVVAIAKSHIGTPYKYGGVTPNGFDCSGLLKYTYKKVGYELLGGSRHIINQGKSISKSEVKPGDLVFFAKNGEVFHVSLVVENKRNDLWVVHSTSSKGVIEENIFASPYWNKKSISYRRIIK